MKKALVFTFTVCIVGSLTIFLRTIDFTQVLDLIWTTGYRFGLLLLITFVAYIFGTISWQFSLGSYRNIVSLSRLFLIRHLGETVGTFNPTSIVGGDALKAILLRNYNIPEKTVVWSMIFSRGIMIVSQAFLFITLGLAFVIGTASHLTAPANHGKYSGLCALGLLRWKIVRLKIARFLREMPVVLRENKRLLMLSFVFAVLHWIAGGLEFYLILKFLGLKVSILQALVVDLGVVVFKAAGAFIPGQLGVEEYGNKIMLIAIGLPSEELWVTVSVLRRARQLFWIVVGLAFYFILSRKQVAVLKS